MSARPDPRWLPAAEWAFNALLCLYPPTLRREHGDEMRQAFRDRCREAGAQRGAARLLLLELLPDTVHGIADAHWHEGSGETRRWHLMAMALLLIASTWLLFQGRVSAVILDWTFQAQYAFQNARQARALAAEEAHVDELAGLIAKEGSAASGAQAAYLYRGLYDARLAYPVFGVNQIDDAEQRYGAYRDILPVYGDAARKAAEATFGKSTPGWIAAAAAQACLSERGCDRAASISRLIALEPRNAFGWALAFKQASLAHDEPRIRRALAGMATASHYDDHLGEIRAAIFASASRLLPQDQDARASVAKRVAESAIDSADFFHDVRRQCRLRTMPSGPPSWVQSHPDSEATCLHIATLLAQSDSPGNALTGQALLAQRDHGATQKAALDRARQFYYATWRQVGGTQVGEDRPWFLPWTSAEWNRWAEQWQPGETEASVARRWNARALD